MASILPRAGRSDAQEISLVITIMRAKNGRMRILSAMNSFLSRVRTSLRWSERYTRIDMVYLFRSGSLLTGADAILAIASLGVSVLIAMMVPKETYGIYRYLIAIAGIAAALSLSGMNNAIARAVALGREGSFARSLPLQARFAVLQILVLAAVAAYYFLKGNILYGASLTAIAFLAPASSVLNTYVAFLNGKRDFLRMAWYRLEGGILQSAMLVAVIFASPNVLALVIAYFLSSLIANSFFTWRTFATYRPNTITELGDLSYGKHLSAMNAAGIVASQLDALLIYHLLGPAALAVYSFAVLIPDRLRAFASFLPSAALPKLAERSANERVATINRRLLIMAIGTGIIAFAYAITAPLLFSIFFPQYLEAVPYTQLASLFVFSMLPVYLDTILTAGASYKKQYVVSIATPFVKIILSLIGIVFFGIAGAIAARILAGLFNGFLSLALIRKF